MTIHYHVDLTRRRQHLVTVRMHLPADLPPQVRIVLPAWTPGSYLIRNYVHHVQSVRAEHDGCEVPLTPDGLSSWRLDVAAVPARTDDPPAEDAGGDSHHDEVTVELELYANEASVRTNHVDDHHALLVPPATFPYLDGATDRPCRVTVDPGSGSTYSLLPSDEDGAFVAEDYDHLVDSAFEAGDLASVHYEVAGVDHEFVWAGHTQPDLEVIASDAAALGEAAVRLFGGDLPAERYTFLCLTSPDGSGGGLEHRDGATLMVPEHGFGSADRRRQFQGLVAHEYLHLWNGRRLSPQALVRPDYEHPALTESLWVAEGWTTYYGSLLPLRAGLWPASHFLDHLARLWTTVAQTPGAARQSVRESSYRAWTHHYVRDENSVNVGVDYYRHGAMLAWMLDLMVRRERPDSDGLDEALRRLWSRFGAGPHGGTQGYTEGDVEQAVSEVAGGDVSEAFRRHVGGRELPPLPDLVAVVGLALRPDRSRPRRPDLGVQTAIEGDELVLSAVLRDRPAWQAGMTGGARLVALDGVAVGPRDLDAALSAFEPGDTVTVSARSGARLRHHPVVLGPPRPGWTLRPVAAPDTTQRAAFRKWTGHDLDDAT